MKRVGIGLSGEITSLFETMMVQAPEEVVGIPTDTQDTPILTQPSSSQSQRKYKSKRKQRKETEVPHTEPKTDEHIPTHSHDLLPSGEDKMQLSELMEICTKLFDRVLSLEQIKTNQAAKIKKLKKRVKKLEGKKKKRTHGLKRLYKVGLSARVESSKEEEGLEVSVAKSVEGITAATTLQIFKDDVILAQTLIEIKAAKPRARGVIVQDPNADRQLAEQLQAQEREQLSIKERSKLLAKLIESRRKYFAAKRIEEIKNNPPTKAQQKSLMCSYMKNMEGYKQKDFKQKIFDAIKKMFDKVYKRVNTCVAMDSKVMEGSKKTQVEVSKGSSKRAGDKIEQESAKRKRLEKENDTAVLKRCLEIVLEDGDDVTIEATPLSSKSPTIVDYKIYKKGINVTSKSLGQMETHKTI
nr:hypothetical protein [Tanacetum cinerariifolium]